MKIVSSREFRARQKEYLDLAEEGEVVYVRRGKETMFRITPVKDDSLMTKEEFYAKIKRSLKQAEEGKVTRMEPGQTIEEFIDKVCTE